MPLPERLAGPELAGLWRRARRAMATAGARWAEVHLRVPLGDDGERHAIAGLLGRVIRPGTASVGTALGDLDAAVRRAGDGWDLRAVVEAIGGPLPDVRGDAAAAAAAAAAAVAAARAAGPSVPWFDAWLDGLAADGGVGRLVGRGEDVLLATAAAVLAELPLAGEPLPAVAARLTGDTKALSTGPLPGLVLRGVAAMLGEDRPVGAAARRALWEAVGVVPDDLASQVLVLNMPVRPVPGLGTWLAGAATDGIPFRVTLHQLTRAAIEPTGPGAVYVCENPAVLRAAAEQLGPRSAPVVCTEGRPSVAAARLLDALAAGGRVLHHRGDFDWPGLRIAGALLSRLGSRPWRFGVADYEAARRRRPGAAARLVGAPAPSPWEPALTSAMATAGEVVFEEELLEVLVADLSEAGERLRAGR